jgi:methionine-R-sulfoxide reductase
MREYTKQRRGAQKARRSVYGHPARGREPPFHNEKWDNHEAGIYVDIVTGEPLFSSLDKYESGQGGRALQNRSSQRTSPRRRTANSESSAQKYARHGNSHLGHVFDDGPQPTGQRYCMNSASMRFIPVAKLCRGIAI